MKRVVGYIGVMVFIVMFVVGFLAYFITSVDPQTGTICDGLGRSLIESPLFLRLIFGQERLWPGWGWFVIDLVVFWGGIGLGYCLINFGFKD